MSRHGKSYPWLDSVATRNSLLRHRVDQLCRNIRRPLSRPKSSPALNPVVTMNLCRDTRMKNLFHDRESLCRYPNHPVGLGTVSRHRDPYLNIKPEGSVARASQPRACLSCAPRLGHAPGLRTLSRHGKPYHDIGLEKPCCDGNFSVATEDPKWAVALSSPPAPLVFLLLFIPKHPKFHITLPFHYKDNRKPGKLAKTYSSYKMSLITTIFFLHIQKLGFLPKFYKIQNKAKSGIFFTTKVLGGLHPSEYL